jgi:non-canonical (house-cleaning) NTP pyrophosphatase
VLSAPRHHDGIDAQDGNEQYEAEVGGVDVPYGVSDQPMGLEESKKLAKVALLSHVSVDTDESSNKMVGVGLESGVLVAVDIHFDVCLCDRG